MSKYLALTAALAVYPMMTGTAAHAQAAAEEAVILSGSSGQGKAARGLGNAIRGSINRASGAIATTNQRRAGVRYRGSNPRRARGPVNVRAPLPANDPLEGTDAPAYALENGNTIRVTGGLRNSASARCTLNCERGEPSPGITVGPQPDSERPRVKVITPE